MKIPKRLLAGLLACQMILNVPMTTLAADSKVPDSQVENTADTILEDEDSGENTEDLIENSDENEISSDESVEEEPKTSTNNEDESNSEETVSEEQTDILNSTTPEETPKEEELDYILGRPLTEEEIASQMEQEPDNLEPLPEEMKVEDGGSSELNRSMSGYYGSNYDLRTFGQVTSVKDQGDSGLCWAFSTLAAAESSLLMDFRGNYDLSEGQLGYFTYNDVVPTGCEGDYARILKGTWYDGGGNGKLSMYSLARRTGAANENLTGFPSYARDYPDNYAYLNNTAVLKNGSWIPMRDSNMVKDYLVNEGALAVPFWYDQTQFNYNTAAYYQGIEASNINHLVTIIGWNDNYSRYNFKSRPSINGAWLCKNSWGTGWGDQGYFWLSYADVSLLNQDACGFQMLPVEEAADKIYEYDGGLSDRWCYYNNASSSYMANVFTADRNELLREVAFFTIQTNLSYEIQIYNNVVDEPTTGTAVLETPIKGTLENAGYHTIELPEEVALYGNKKFSVVIKLIANDPNITPYMLSDETRDYGWYYTNSSSEAGQSYTGLSGSSWSDLSASGDRNLRIKAFTDMDNRTDINSFSLSYNYGYTYTGNVIKPLVELKNQNTTLREKVDYKLTYSNDMNVGTKKFTVTGMGNYTGIRTYSYSITKKNLSTVHIDQNLSDTVYTGYPIEPDVPVNESMEKNRDYTLSYTDNINAGTGKIIMTGIGNYTGVRNFYFKINKAEITEVENIADKPYENRASIQAPLVFCQEQQLTEGQDYDISYKNNTVPGMATVTITGKGNYTGVISKDFLIYLTSVGWKKVGNYWYYTSKANSLARSTWVKSSGKWYYMGADGKMQTNTFVANGNYHVDGFGVMQTGWIKANGAWYYGNSSGYLYRNQWLKLGKSWYYLKSDKKMAVGWLRLGKTWYYLNSSGVMKTGWIKLGSKWYYLNGSGVMQTGWKKIGTKWYYMYSDGAMAANTWIGNYYVNSSGVWTKSR